MHEEYIMIFFLTYIGKLCLASSIFSTVFPYKFKSFLGIGLQGFFSGSTLTYDSIYSWLCAKSANASLSVISYIFFETLREFVNYLCKSAMDLSHSFLSVF